MNCQEVVETMNRFLDRDLNSEETAIMYQHIAVCPMCAETFNILKSLNRELEDLPDVTPPISLVDAIMPTLDTLDRDRHNLMTPIAVKSQEPAEMLPDASHTKSRHRWWNSTGGRSAIGVAAAALIIGVAIFNHEPQTMSDAQIPYNEQASTTIAGTAESTTEESTVDQMSRAEYQGESTKNSTGAEDAKPSDEGQDKPVLSDDPDDPNVQPQSQADETTDATHHQQGDVGSPDTPVSNGASVPDRSVTNKSTTPEGKDASVHSPSTKENPGQDTEATSPAAPNESMDPLADGPPAGPEGENGMEAGAMGLMDQESSMRMDLMLAPVQWTSPDQQYLASLEADQLVIYRLSSSNNASNEAMEVMHSVPLGSGIWVSGQWSENSLTFKYKIQLDNELVESIYSVEKSPSKSSTQQKKTK